jgi:hypothetical protein
MFICGELVINTLEEKPPREGRKGARVRAYNPNYLQILIDYMNYD